MSALQGAWLFLATLVYPRPPFEGRRGVAADYGIMGTRQQFACLQQGEHCRIRRLTAWS
jgi:hypothetical protein